MGPKLACFDLNYHPTKEGLKNYEFSVVLTQVSY